MQTGSDGDLAKRVRMAIARRKGVTEKRIFGGHCFLLRGNMIGGVAGNGELIVRVGPDDYAHALAQPHVRRMDFTGRPMRGFVVVEPRGLESDEDLRFWLEWGCRYAGSLPAK